jgi:hypothetical protein
MKSFLKTVSVMIFGLFIFGACQIPGDNGIDAQNQLSYVDKSVTVDKDNVRPKADLNTGDVQMVTSDDGSRSATSFITEVYVILGDSASITPPAPYIKLTSGVLGYGNGDLNQGAGGKYIYLCYTRDNAMGNPVTNFSIYSRSSSSCTPPANYYHVPNSDGYPPYGSRGADLNKGSGGNYIYLMETKNPASGLPIRNVGIISTDSKLYYPPEGWQWIGSDLNAGAGGKYIYLLYQN